MGIDKVTNKILILLDTNTLIQLYEGGNLFEDIEGSLDVSPIYICPDAVLAELEKFSLKTDELGRASRLALNIAKNKCKIMNTGEISGDRALIKLAYELTKKGERVMVATSDRELRKRLSQMGIRTIYYRKTQHRFEVETKDVL